MAKLYYLGVRPREKADWRSKVLIIRLGTSAVCIFALISNRLPYLHGA